MKPQILITKKFNSQELHLDPRCILLPKYKRSTEETNKLYKNAGVEIKKEGNSLEDV